MAVNKVEFNNSDGTTSTLIDLTSDTVTPESLEEGITAHSADGGQIVGVRTFHTHENLSVLDGITSEKVSSWDGKAEADHTHSQYITQDDLDVVRVIASESRFKANVLSKSYSENFDTLCIETFEDTDDINQTKLDGAYVVENFFSSDKHCIVKTTTDERSIQSSQFEVEHTPYHVWIYADYDGAGSVTISFSKNGGEDWVAVPNDTMVDLNALVQKSVVIKLVLNGVVRLKNIAWGVR